MLSPARAWLVKSEPSVYSIDDLSRDGRTLWTGVRNYQARNFMTQGMQVGDPVLLYHSNADPPGIAGLLSVSGPAVADPTHFDPRSEYHEPRASRERPTWSCVELAFVAKAPRYLSLEALRAEPALAQLMLLQKGSRLSVQPVPPAAFLHILEQSGLRARPTRGRRAR